MQRCYDLRLQLSASQRRLRVRRDARGIDRSVDDRGVVGNAPDDISDNHFAKRRDPAITKLVRLCGPQHIQNYAEDKLELFEKVFLYFWPF